MEIGERIRKLRESLGLTLEEVGEYIGVNKATVQRYESGNIDIKRNTAIKLAEILNTTPSYIMGWISSSATDYSRYSNISAVKMRKFPLLGNIAAGIPIYAEEEHETYIEASSDIRADFCLTAKGDSMTGARINDGDVVFIQKQNMVDNGEIAAVIIDDEATLKRVYYYPKHNKLVLASENSKYPPFVYVDEELEEIYILGKAVAFMSNVI